MSPILIAVCLSLTSDPGEEKGIDFPQKSNVPPVTPGIPRTKNLGEQIDFYEKRIRQHPHHESRAHPRDEPVHFDARTASYTIRDSFRTFCRSPTAEIREVFEGLRELRRVG